MPTELNPAPPRIPLQSLEEAILRNRQAKKGLPDCPCWANAPQWRDAELYAALDLDAPGESAGARLARLESAVRRHHQAGGSTPECSCWSTPARALDAELYALLGLRPGRASVR